VFITLLPSGAATTYILIISNQRKNLISLISRKHTDFALHLLGPNRYKPYHLLKTNTR
jgi:hypothetical protein